MSALNIVLLSALAGESCEEHGPYPDYLAERSGKPLIQSLIDDCAGLEPARIICTFTDTDIARLHLRNMVQQMHPAASVLPVHGITRGAACTVLLASEQIDNQDELLILSTSDRVEIDLEDVLGGLRGNGNDAGVVIFRSLHPRYSFVRLDADDRVVEAAEKNPISPHAIAGVYWFRHGAAFVAAAKEMIRKDARVNDSFFIAPVLNELVLQHRRIGVYRIESARYHPLKTASQLQAFEAGSAR
ncbi:glycosyltransferase family 2 protein [Pseudomonas sp. DTU_2021_1001937_2_SI_NGA_ILE_001]|uniref:glycosyltransferase family 2 protein n=1 Tax=Pseudomonas sp. DTU_2021_1001937_2_SI_NGA_ILE_001 TaxID=3077589 RepID=UPI0026007226|nr:glycosyltransferase family 2 protein [Pseudomonas sp. DTU_2021_1001937_2_SI_NGA_ILE_001]WNW13227.1 glycosyltransferase family 2 protein [Pseudomonas sp. DTU_2021_1001937_2_SI_NGA_ILE_001]